MISLISWLMYFCINLKQVFQVISSWTRKDNRNYWGGWKISTFVCHIFQMTLVLSYNISIGVWRSLVAHLHGVQGVEGSNPFTPTIFNQWNQRIATLSVAILFSWVFKIRPLHEQGRNCLLLNWNLYEIELDSRYQE